MDALMRASSQCLGGGAESTSSVRMVVATTAVVTISLVFFSRSLLYPAHKPSMPNPLKTALPKLSPRQLAELEYQPDHFPGARDVATPYGSIRVYEYGLEGGEKVLLVHGISTSCMTLTHIANGLVKRGCRVMLFDLFGRGFSDGVGDLPHDARLYTAQILCVLASSPLAWTGSDAVTVVGYSLGGGIAVHFAGAFPHLVKRLILLAPSGLIRAASFGIVSQLVFKSGLVPERILAVLTARRLQQPIASSRVKAEAAEAVLKDKYLDAAVAEAADPPDGKVTPLESRVLQYVRWMVVHHEGFISSFMSCIRHGPLTDQHESWRALSQRKPGTTAIFLAQTDEIIEAEDYKADALSLIGSEDVVAWKVLPGGHDFVMTHSDEVLASIDEIWKA